MTIATMILAAPITTTKLDYTVLVQLNNNGTNFTDEEVTHLINNCVLRDKQI